MQGDGLVRRLAVFGCVLREGGAHVDPGRLQDAVRALDAVDVTDRDDAYWALRSTLISHHKDIAAFDVAFAWLWERAGARGDADDHDTMASPSPAEDRAPEAGPAAVGDEPRPQPAPAGGEDDAGDEEPEHVGLAWSAAERLRELDFGAYDDHELRQAKRLMARIARARPTRLSRRLTPGHRGRTLDTRRTMLSAMRSDGYPLERRWLQRKVVARRLVFVIDVSGSMQPYARAMIMFLQAAVHAGGRVEAFTFGTRLTQVTKELGGHDPDRAMARATRAVPDWAGGTRIGDNLKAFNDRFGPRGTSRGAVVVIVSDGWERGDVGCLADEMARLRRAAHAIVWVNPLAGDADYEPLAQGMAAALPHVDHFMPGHNLSALDALAGVIESLPAATGAGRS